MTIKKIFFYFYNKKINLDSITTQKFLMYFFSLINIDNLKKIIFENEIISILIFILLTFNLYNIKTIKQLFLIL